MARWEIANRVGSDELRELIDSGDFDVTGVLTITLDGDDPAKIAAIEKSAAEAGFVLVRLEDE